MTAAGDIIGTPQYMAPESFEARYDVASETWCLGATLYELVTLRPAFEPGSTAEIIRRITSTTPTKPRKVDPRIPHDLSTIIEKSISLEPEDRYKSAARMRDDLRAYLQDRPISAKPAPIHRKVWLWSKRNPWQAISAGLVGLVAVLATAGFISRSQSLRESFSQNQLLIKERDHTREAKELAERNAAKYMEQYERAEANVDLSLEMFDEMFRQMVIRGTGRQQSFSFDGFQELVGIETAISHEDAEYLENMLVFVQKFADGNSDNKELAAESAKSFRRVANIYHLLGRYEDARSAYRKAIRQYAALNSATSNLAIFMEQAQTANELGLLTLNNGNYRSALQIFEEVRARLENAPGAHERIVQMELVRTLNLMGSSAPIESSEALMRDRDAGARSVQGDRRRGFRTRTPRSIRKMGNDNLQFITSAIEQVNQLIDTHGVCPEFLLERAKSFLRLAELQYWMNRKEASLKSKMSAVEDLSRLTNDLPDSPEYQAVLAQAYAMPIEQGDAESLQELMKANKITSSLCESFPSNTNYLQLDAEVNYQLGQLQEDLKNTKVAIVHYQEALSALRQVWRLAPRNVQILGRLSNLTVELAELLIKQEMYREARELLTANLRRMNLIRNTQNRNMLGRARMAQQYQLLARVQEELGDMAGARRAGRMARESRQKPPSPSKDKPSGKRPPRKR